MAGGRPLLEGEDGPVVIINERGRSPILLVCEHAGRRIPRQLGTLGLPDSELERHIAWDIGAEAVARLLSERLDAALVLQRFSRLVYDCNRPPEAADAMPVLSESTPIPGNRDLTQAERDARIEAIYRPFHAAVARLLDERQTTILVTVHSFTPVYKGVRRSLDLGLLHDSDARFADRLLRVLDAESDLTVRRNEPYGPQDGVTHTLILHALPRRLHNVMLEIRNDLIADPPGQRRMAERLARRLGEAVATLSAEALRAAALP
jgi:predicted N-formylglutamate amidohydrolase